LAAVAGLGLCSAIIRFIPAKTDKAAIREDFYSVLCITFATILLVSAIIAACAPFIARVFFDGATTVVRLTALIVLLSSCNGVYLCLIRAFRSSIVYGAFMLLDTYAQVGLIAYLVLHGYGVLSVFYGVAAIRILLFLCLATYVTTRIGLSRPRFTNMRDYLRFSLPTIANAVSWWVVSSSDRYVIAGFLGTTSVGIYSAGYGLGNIFMMVVGIIGLVLAPTASKLYDEGKTEELTPLLGYSVKYLLLLAIPFVVGAAILGEPILRVLSSPEIAARGHHVVPIIALTAALFAVNAVVGLPLILAKKTPLAGIAWAAAAVVNLALNLVLVPWIGIIGSALGSLLSVALATGICAYYSSRELKAPVDLLFVVKSLVASGVMALVLWLVAPEGTVSVLLCILLGVAVYAAVMLPLRGLARHEFLFFWSLVRGKG
jgi:O-antigen/teichoic acid export membrane protein